MDQRTDGDDQGSFNHPPARPDVSHWDVPPASPRPVRGHPVLAWLVIAVGVAATLVMHGLDVRASKTATGQDRLGVMMMEMQAKYFVGAADVQDNRPLLYASAEKALNVGSVGQRQRFVILAAELMGPEKAREKLEELSNDILKAQNDPTIHLELTETEAAVQQALWKLYGGHAAGSQDDDGTPQVDTQPEAPAVDALSPDERQLLVRELGWFGKLALAPPNTTDAAARAEVLRPARQVLFVVIGIFTVFVIAGLAGFAGLIVWLVFALAGKVRSGMHPGRWHHGIYAETFAIWFVLLLSLQLAAAVVASFFPPITMPVLFVAFFASLLALCWPVIRGVPWSDVREDIGWTLGRAGILEPLAGVAGYFMALPVLAAGAALSYLLIMIQNAFKPVQPLFEPSGGPAHPIIEQLGGSDWLPKIMVVLLGAVAAPIVEETMFRGVMYRHLRDATGGAGRVMSVVLSTAINSFVFAVIHPQGWVAVPALMSLAIMFSLMREWRGSLIPSMIMHGLSNFIVLTLVMIVLSL